MKLLYSNILPLGTEDDQETIMDCFNEQMKIADRVEIAVGYTSNGEFDEILKDVMNRSEEDLCLSAPGFDIRGIQHEKLYSRLYMS